jgi:hypothetical protein
MAKVPVRDSLGTGAQMDSLRIAAEVVLKLQKGKRSPYYKA